MRQGLAALASGLVFGLGLAVAGMTDPRKVLAFLDLAGAWDPSLLLVLGAAVTVTFVGYRWVLRRPAPLFDSQFHLPTARAIDAPLLAGALLFGIGWGLAGYCPGPAIASIGYGNPEAWLLLPALVAGSLLRRWQTRQR
ncbi:MAG: YeeE/YedE thiosulfate transporter family protein [Comamonas sp.]